MNKENMQLVLDHIIAHEEKFDMSTFGNVDVIAGHICCTAACICGTANLIAKSDEVENIFNESNEYNYETLYKILRNTNTGAEFLGISRECAEFLFVGGDDSIWNKYREELNFTDYILNEDIKSEHAITMLTNLISGEWNFESILPSEEDEDE